MSLASAAQNTRIVVYAGMPFSSPTKEMITFVTSMISPVTSIHLGFI